MSTPDPLDTATPAQRRTATEVALDLTVPEHVWADVAAMVGTDAAALRAGADQVDTLVQGVVATVYAATIGDLANLDAHAELVGSTAARLGMGVALGNRDADRAITAVLANLARLRRIETALVAMADEFAATDDRIPADAVRRIIARGGRP